MTDEPEDDFYFWGDRLGIPCGDYNSEVTKNILDVAEAIVTAHRADKFVYCTDIATALGLAPTHVELIQYILAGIKVLDAFTYGTSPRGLFVKDIADAERFLEECKREMKNDA